MPIPLTTHSKFHMNLNTNPISYTVIQIQCSRKPYGIYTGSLCIGKTRICSITCTRHCSTCIVIIKLYMKTCCRASSTPLSTKINIGYTPITTTNRKIIRTYTIKRIICRINEILRCTVTYSCHLSI